MSRSGHGMVGQAWRRIASPCHVRRFRQDDSGAVALIAAVTGLVLVVLAGAAIDMALYAERRSQIAAAVDSALLAAVTSANQAEAAGRSLTEAASAGAAAAATVYGVDTAGIGADVTNRDLSITVEKKTVSNVKKWVASATVDGSYATYFMKIMGTHTLPLKVAAASAGAINKTMDYWQYYIAVDVSQSMGIGTTAADMKAMIAYDKCYFACHEGPNDRMSKLRAKGIDFRIDAVSRAVNSMISTIKTKTSGNAEVGIYRIYSDLLDGVPITSDFSKLLDYKIELPVWIQEGRALELKTSDGDTNFRASMKTLTDTVPTPGDGSSASNPKRAVFLITDGVHDSKPWESNTVWQSWDQLHHTGPMDPAFCKDLKKKGVLVAVLYIPYHIPPGVTIGEVDDFKNQIQPNLKACASSDSMFFNASDSSGISVALQSMLKVVNEADRVRLTN